MTYTINAKDIDDIKASASCPSPVKGLLAEQIIDKGCRLSQEMLKFVRLVINESLVGRIRTDETHTNSGQVPFINNALTNAVCFNISHICRPRYTKVQDSHFLPSLQPHARLSLHSFRFSSVSLFMADENGTFYQNAICG